MINFDNSYRTGGISLVCGLDEAGRGPLAGPVVAAAAVFAPGTVINGVNDSKKLSAKTRAALFDEIMAKAAACAYSIQPIEIIDEKNILHASLYAMSCALNELKVKPDILLIDGNRAFKSEIKTETIIKGDAKSFSIAAASIVAKVVRDRIMDELAPLYPQYGWDENKGYPTKKHIQALLQYGPTPHHRKTFLKNLKSWEQNELFK